MKDKVYAKITVNPWKTRFHSPNIGIKQKARNIAKARQHYTKDMKIFGKVTEEIWNEATNSYEKDTSYMGLRENEFDEYKKNTKTGEYKINKKTGEKELNLERRLLIRTFDDEEGEAGEWISSLAEMTEEEISETYAALKPSLEFKIIMNGYGYVANIRQAARRDLKHTLSGKLFHFKLEMEKKVEVGVRKKKKVKKKYCDAFIIDEDRLTIGNDYEIFSLRRGKEKIAYINHKIFNPGGKYKIKIFHKEFANNKYFKQMLILFGASIKYHEGLEKIIENRMEMIRNGVDYNGPKGEKDLEKNPRRRKF